MSEASSNLSKRPPNFFAALFNSISCFSVGSGSVNVFLYGRRSTVVASTTVVPVVEGVSDGLATVSGVAQAAARARSATPIATLMHEEYDEPGVLEAERENHPLTHA